MKKYFSTPWHVFVCLFFCCFNQIWVLQKIYLIIFGWREICFIFWSYALQNLYFYLFRAIRASSVVMGKFQGLLSSIYLAKIKKKIRHLNPFTKIYITVNTLLYIKKDQFTFKIYILLLSLNIIFWKITNILPRFRERFWVVFIVLGFWHYFGRGDHLKTRIIWKLESTPTSCFRYSLRNRWFRISDACFIFLLSSIYFVIIFLINRPSTFSGQSDPSQPYINALETHWKWKC